MRILLSILLFAIASCTAPQSPTQGLCVQYRIGSAVTTSTVQFVQGFVVVDNWRLIATSTPNNQTRLSCDTTVYTAIGEVYQQTEFLFDNRQIGDTIQGVCIRHTRGSVCNTINTLPVTVIKVPCTSNPYNDL